MCCHQTLNALPKHWPKKINQVPYKICYTENITNFPEGTTVDTTHLQPGEILHTKFFFYNVTSTRGFNSILTVVCAKTRILWFFHAAPKWPLVHIIQLILTKSNNEQHPCKHVRINEDGTLEKSTDVTNLLNYDLSITMETTGGDSSWINGKNERHNRSINIMVISGLIDSNQHEKMVLYRINKRRSL